MKSKQAVIVALALGAIVAVSVLAYRYAGGESQTTCQLCQRVIHAETGFRLDTRDGSKHACCPRCGLRLKVQDPATVVKAWATDLPTGAEVAADQAVYVEGGDVLYCARHESAVEREAEGLAIRGYDRCMPTLVAFRSRADAEAYQTRHGGRILGFSEAVESVRQR